VFSRSSAVLAPETVKELVAIHVSVGDGFLINFDETSCC